MTERAAVATGDGDTPDGTVAVVPQAIASVTSAATDADRVAARRTGRRTAAWS
jgi:hypothetical protein